ncbi:MAG: hypothetical protein J0L72_09560 [Armatimonadetes bacterium]|nr:hypothetical protein [Armatimonadota bacterium]
MARRYAAADIGSNTVHLLVAEITPTGIRQLMSESNWLSLGEVVSREKIIPPKVEQSLIDSLKVYRKAATELGAPKLQVFATEAMRIAQNHEEVLKRIRTESGVNVEVISAIREAELSLLGTSLDTHFDGPHLMIEVGGGSVQVALCEDGKILDEHSLSIGTGRLKAKFNLEQPSNPEVISQVRHYCRSLFERCPKPERLEGVVASGGVARGLLRALHPDGAPILRLFEVDYLVRSVAELTEKQICRRFHVKGKRAGTLLCGSIIFQEMLRHYYQDRFTVSEFGVREGAVLEQASEPVLK